MLEKFISSRKMKNTSHENQGISFLNLIEKDLVTQSIFYLFIPILHFAIYILHPLYRARK